MYLIQIQEIKISHELQLSENKELFNAQTQGFSDLKLSKFFHLPQYPIQPSSSCNLLIIKIEETDSWLKDILLIANLRSFMIEAKNSKKKMWKGYLLMAFR